MEGEVPGQSDSFCKIKIPLHSPGIWELDEAKEVFNYSLPRLQLQLAAFFVVTQSLHLIFRRVFVPRIVSELLAGIIIGNTVLGQISSSISEILIPNYGELFIEVLSKIGFIFFMFLIGVKMDPALLTRTGAKAWAIGLAAMVGPLWIGQTLTNRARDDQHPYRFQAFNNIFAVQTLTPFPVIASLLIDMKIMNSELGRLTLASTLVADLFSTFNSVLLSTLRMMNVGSLTSLSAKSVLLSALSIAISVFAFRPVFVWIIKKTPEGKPVKRVDVILVCIMVLSSALISDNVGLPYQFGPFIVGLCVPDGPPLGSTLVEKLDTLTSGLFAPLIAISCGLKLNLNMIYDLKLIAGLLIGVTSNLAGRMASIFIPAAVCRVPVRDAVVLSLIMSTQGIVQMSMYADLFENQTIDGDGYTVVMLQVLFVATMTSVAARLTYDYSRTYAGYRKRSVIHSNNADLRILVCAHRHDDAMAAVKLIETSHPTGDSPISIYALNLVELVGRATPLIINHKFGQKSNSDSYQSHQIIDLFTKFEKRNPGSITAHVFTAMSLPKFMHLDICSVAFDKLTSLIILPFHKKWSQQGKVVLDSITLRTVNSEVLSNAPCSVGIFIDRRRIKYDYSDEPLRSRYLITVVFIGGNDDREALAYAKRMAKSPGVHLTVIRLIGWEDFGEKKQWDTILDTEELKGLRLQGAQQDNIIYREEKVKDGADTALIINDLQEAFDLIIVGRQHKKDSPLLLGLSEWMELPELGTIGDILASSDIKRPVSVLIVQQQVVKGK